MKKIFTLCALMFLLIQNTEAKIWRVNNNSSVQADFTTVSDAVSHASEGDTIYIEGSAAAYNENVYVSKRLYIIGAGYYLRDKTPNPRTQNNTVTVDINFVTFNPGSAGSVLEGIGLANVIINENSITIQRNRISAFLAIADAANSVCNNDTIRQNVIYKIIAETATGKASNLMVYNNIFNGPVFNFYSNVDNISGDFFNNDCLEPATLSCVNFTFQNNIFNGVSLGTYMYSNVFLNNISSDEELPYGNGNQSDIDLGTVFNGFSDGTGFSSDGRYRLKTGSPAIGAGSLNGTTADCGAFGGPAPYILSGMPPIPSIYILTIPPSVPGDATDMNVTISSTTVH